jgi:arylsulfatase A-like enzyme
MMTVYRLLFKLVILMGLGSDIFAQNSHPNVVLLLADDMGWGDLSKNGNIYVQTPTLDRLAARSLSFDRFYVCPLCAPTRAEILTGRYFLRTGVSSVSQGAENMRSEEVTVAEVFKKNGYSTGCFGKWHNGSYFEQHPNRQGFDEFVGFCVGHLGYYYDAVYMYNDGEVKSKGFCTDYFTDKALDFIEKNSKGQFFCYLAFNVPHSPFQVPDKYFHKYKEKGLNNELSAIYGMTENMDENINRVLSKLDQLKISNNTIVVFLSDNGPNTFRYNGKMKGKKGSVDEGGLRVPFYISWPGIIKNAITAQLAQDIDFFPTILHLCNIKYLSSLPVDGKDLSDVITEGKKPEDRYIFSRQANLPLRSCNGSVRNDRYRLIVTQNDTSLFDMYADPSQTSDISGIEKETTSMLATVYNKWETELISTYVPVKTIKVAFPEEKKFTLPVQDATLSGVVKYSSIYPNQSYTQNWIMNGDSVYWALEVENTGHYLVEIQYGCPVSQTGSKMLVHSGSDKLTFTVDHSFESVILPEQDRVIRGESYERTWDWMTIGKITLMKGHEVLVLKLLKKEKDEAGLFKAIRLVKL